MKKILVPCDFSEPAQEAYKFALSLAKANKSQLFVLKAIDLPMMYESAFGVQPYLVDSGLLLELEENAKSSFVKLKEKFGVGDDVTFSIVRGPVALSIRDFSKENNIDLIVMGTHGAGGLKEYLLGSNTEKIVRTSKAPVFAVRKAPAIESIKNIVFPANLSLDHPEFVAKVKSLQDFFNAALHILFINTPVDFRTDRDIKVAMGEFTRYFKLNNYTLNVRNDAYEMDGILGFADEIKADMIAMATHGRRGLLHLLTGSIAEDVMNHCECLMWTCSLKGKEKQAKNEFQYEEDFSAY